MTLLLEQHTQLQKDRLRLRKSSRRQKRRKQNLQGWLFIAPIMLGIAAFQGAPIVVAILASFSDWDGLTPPNFEGMNNYVALAHDPIFWVTLRNTVLFTVGMIPLSVVGGLGLALLCNGRKGPATAFFRTAYFMPYITSVVAIGLVWGKLLTPNGAFNQLLGFFGIQGPAWLASSKWALIAVIIVSAWQAVGYPMVILLAGLQAIPETLYEAAKIDGARAIRRFWNVTLPLLTPQLFFVVVTQFIVAFQIFALIFVLTRGGPGTATNVYIYYLYQNAFTFGRLGYASAMAWILFLMIGLVTFLQLRMQKKWVFYG